LQLHASALPLKRTDARMARVNFIASPLCNMILILGDAQDDHSVWMWEYLKDAGAQVELLSSIEFPESIQISLFPQADQGVLTSNGQRFAFDDIRSVYWRTYHGQSLPDIPDLEQQEIAANDSRSLFESFVMQLPALWVNGWEAYQMHQRKPVQLAAVARLGIRVPATCLGNDPDAIRSFISEHKHCIFKPVQGGAHTRQVGQEHLKDENLASLRIAPVTIQERIDGTDIRAFVVGEEVMAIEIETEHPDFRDDPNPRMQPIALDDSFQSQCRRIARDLKLVWTGIDFRRTQDGEFVFLEANPSPMFLGFQARTCLPIGETLAGLLLNGNQAQG